MKIVQKKICLLGDFSVGKTSLIRRYVEERFDENYLSTVGVHISRKRLHRGEHLLDFFIWDLAGGDQFSQITPNYLRGAAGAIIVCDLTRASTIPALADYARQLRQINAKAALVFAANKLDLEEQHVVDRENILAAISPYADVYLLTSAKTGHNVTEAFVTLANGVEETT